MATSRKKAIEQSLLAQLAIKGAAVPHFVDLIHDYMKLWDVKELLIADINKRGISFLDHGSAGKEMMKNNPSVKELHATNKQMLAMLKELDITTDNVDDPDVDI